MSTYRPAKPETIVSPFEIPHAGTSYNPSFKDHLNLASEVVSRELATQKEEAHLTRVTQKLFKQISADQNEKNWIQEMTEGLPLNIKQKVIEVADCESDTEYKAINPPVSRDKKKTIKQRKKELRLKQEELKRKETEEQKKKASDIYKVQQILQEIEDEEIQKTKRKLKRLQKSSKKFESARRVGKNKFNPVEPAISDVSELTGSLREIIPQGSVLKDRFASMQKRSLIEVMKPQFKKKKKKKMKKYKLDSHRLEPLEFSASELRNMKT